MRKVLTAFFVILVAAGPAVAQDNKPVGVNFGFGWAFPTSGFKDSFNAGWNGALGLSFNVNRHVSIQTEYIYQHMDGPEKTINVVANPIAGAASTSGLLQSNQHMHIGAFDLVYHSQSPDRPIGWYALGGAGIYHRTIEVTTPSVGYTTFCDPYWYACYPALVSVDKIIGDRSSSDFGMDFGGGITFGTEAKFYIESRYHYVWGPTITSTTTAGVADTSGCATGCSSNASYFPLTFGVRW